MCKLSFIHLVNENFSILSLMLLFSSIFSATVYLNFHIDLLCVGSTHLHGIRAEGLLGKIHTKLFFQVPKIEDSEKIEFPKEFILTPYNFFAWKEKMIMHLRSRVLYSLTMNTEAKPTSSIKNPNI
jgi:hypothetical protein